MADASDGHVLESDKAETTVLQQDQETSSLDNGTGGGPATPVETFPDYLYDDGQNGTSPGVKDSFSALSGGDTEEPVLTEEDPVKLSTEQIESETVADDDNSRRSSEELPENVWEAGAQLCGAGDPDVSRDDQEEEDEVLQIEVPCKSRETSQSPLQQGPEENPLGSGSKDNVEDRISPEPPGERLGDELAEDRGHGEAEGDRDNDELQTEIVDDEPEEDMCIDEPQGDVGDDEPQVVRNHEESQGDKDIYEPQGDMGDDEPQADYGGDEAQADRDNNERQEDRGDDEPQGDDCGDENEADRIIGEEPEAVIKGPRTPASPATPATPLQDETGEAEERFNEVEDMPILEDEAPDLEQEAPILQPEEIIGKNRSPQTEGSSVSEQGRNEVTDFADKKLEADASKTVIESEVMDIDEINSAETKHVGKEVLETIAEDVEMEEKAENQCEELTTNEQEKSEQQNTFEESPEPPVLDPVSVEQSEKQSNENEIEFLADEKESGGGSGENDKDENIENVTQNEDSTAGESQSSSKDNTSSRTDEKNDKETEVSNETSKDDKKAEDEDDDVMVIEDEKTEPEAIVLDDDDEDDLVKSPGKTKDAQKNSDGASSNDMGLQIASVTSGAEASGLRIASVTGASAVQDKESVTKTSSKEPSQTTQEPLKTKIKQEKITPPSTPVPAAVPTRKVGTPGSTPTGGPGGKKSNKMQSCIVCGKIGRCKYNIVRNGDIKHLCDDVCFRKFRANPTMFLKNTPSAQQKTSGQPTTRSQTGSLKPAPKSSSQAEYKTCTVCQLMNINTQKPFVVWMNTDFCSEACLSKYQGNLNSSCSYCTSFVAPNTRPVHCLQVGTEFKTFCSAKCNAEFKKRLRLCAFCQKDLSTVSDSFCAPVEPNKFRDFCSKLCLKKYEEKSNDVEIIGIESTGKKTPAHKCAVCSKVVQIKHNVKLNGVLNRLCSDPCLSAFQYANKLAMNTCDNCGGLCPAEEVISHFIQFEGQQKRFCKDACVNTFRSKHRKIVPCAWCGSKKTNFDMIERVDSNNKYQLFCSLNCLSLYRVNLQAKSNQAVTCDHCHKFVPAQYHLTMSDASVRNFCSYNCVMSFQSQFSANSKNSSQPTIHSQQRVQLQSKPSARGSTNPPAQPQAQSNSFPIISNVVSLAPQGQKQQTVNIKSNTPVPVVVGQGGKQSVSTGTTQQIIIQPPPPKQMKNKSLLCKPFVQTKATSCRPHTLHKEVQTDEHQGKPVLIPVPVPIYIPCPLAMYTAPTPQMVPIPVPIPVPVFIPTAKKTADKILKHIKEIQEKIPSDPLEAELLMMAEAVAGGGGDSDSDSGKEEAEPFPPVPVNEKEETTEIEPVIDRGPPGGGEEDLVQMALRMAEEITGPVLDLETSVEPMAVNTDNPQVQTPPESVRMLEDEEEEYIAPRETRSRRGKRGSRGRGGRQSKRARMEIQEPEPSTDPSPPPVAPPQPPPDANMHLKYTYGVNAWRHWVVHKNTLLEKVSKRGSGKLKLFKTDLLQCTADELNYSLCLFVKEVRKPNGEEYSPDSIYYLCLGIQQYLYENSRIDNIFTDLYYEKFTECLNDVLGKYEPKVNATGQMLCRIEEEHIWECKQLGAHSPYVLLNTLIYFNTKHFMLKSTDEHMKLSFAHILKHWKKGGPGSKVVTGQGRSVSLRYYCLNPGNGQNTPNSKKPKEGIPVYETSENLENPLRCPVKLYEFYLSKCPESIKNRNDMFYLVPERSCVPDSPVWYSTQSISGDSMSKMLNRILLVREIQEAHIHAQPIYV